MENLLRSCRGTRKGALDWGGFFGVLRGHSGTRCGSSTQAMGMGVLRHGQAPLFAVIPS